MLKICKNDKNKVKQLIQNKVLDDIVASNSNLIDDIILSMSRAGVIDCLKDGFKDYRRHNTTVPLQFMLTLAIAAKMKTKTSLTDIPYAITNHKALSELGYNLINKYDCNGLLSEGTIRHLLDKYTKDDLIDCYNKTVQNYIFPKLDIIPNIHILDCTKIAVNEENQNYENATWAIDRKGNKMFGYKLSSLRGLYGDTGVIEDVRFGTAATHDLELSREMLRTTPCFRACDVLLVDRGFFSREEIYYLKHVRHVDVYIPLKKDLAEYDMAIALAEELDDWRPHPTRKNQMVCHIPCVDGTYNGNKIDFVIEFNTAVVWIEDTQSYIVLATTDMDKTAKEIVRMYELRTEIEEDFRQLKDFWKLENFKSTKFNVISFHIICMLFGYLFYQLYLNTEDGHKYVGKCLPVILKNYKEEFTMYLSLYAGEYFCNMSLREFVEFRDGCDDEVKKLILDVLR